MRQFLLLVTLAFMLVLAPPGYTSDAPGEYRVKAAYLYNFAKFIDWPDSTFNDAKTPLVIGVLGKNVFNGELVPLSLKTVRNRPIEIKQFKTLKDVKSCHLLYISPSELNEIEAILKDLRSKPILTVGDDKNFAKYGGVIQFLKKRERLHFIINLEVAKANDIKINSQLLSLAAEILGGRK